MFEEPHHLELPEDALTADEALKNVGQFLQRDPLPVPRVSYRPHHPERSIPVSKIFSSLWYRWQNFDDGNGDDHAVGDDGKVDVLPDGPVGLEVRSAAGGSCKYFS